MGDDWASKVAQRLRDGEEQQKRNEAEDMRRASLLRSHAPMLWEDLKETINRKASELNEAYGQKLLTVSPLVQNRRNLEVEGKSAHLRLEFNQEVPAVSHKVTKGSVTPWTTGAHSKGDLLLVVDRDQVWFINKGESGTYKSVEQTAEYLLNDLF
jgi:hypothetical protein